MKTVTESTPTKQLETLYQIALEKLESLNKRESLNKEELFIIDQHMGIIRAYIKMRNNVLNEQIFRLKFHSILNPDSISGLKDALKDSKL